MEKEYIIKQISELIKKLNLTDWNEINVINWLNSELKAPKYINYSIDILKLLDRNNVKSDKKEEIVRLINEYNEQFYNDELKERDNHNKLAAKYGIENTTSIILPNMQDRIITLKEEKSLTKSNNIILDAASFYYHQINNNRYSLLKVEDILNTIDSKDSELICKYIALELKKEINIMYTLLSDKNAGYSKEELEELKEEILLYNELYNFVSNYSSCNDENVEISKKLLIFPQTKNDKCIFMSHLKAAPYECYISFLNLIKSLENGTNLNFKKLYNEELFNGLMEVRGFQSRIIFDYFVDKNTYVVIAAFIKKSYDYDNKIKNMLENAVSNYLSFKESMKDILLDEEAKKAFYKEQAIISEENKTYLKNNAKGV
jgi:hypothetical protein